MRCRSLAGWSWIALLLAGLTALLPLSSHAGTLPEDRADLLYHRYEGGGVTIHGPSVLVRKTMAEKYSVSANYYMDMVSSASIDVEVSGASKYKEQRNQYSLGFDYLRGKTTYSLGYTGSSENDYKASNFSFGLSQDLFGDLTTLSMGFSKGSDTVSKKNDRSFEADIDRWSYRVGLSQILTKRLLVGANLEVITDEGYLNNPYRSFRYLDPEDPTHSSYRLATEIYPRTRTSNAISLNARYFLPYRAAIHGSYRFFTDTWGIGANTFEIGYVHPLKATPWTFEASVRYYRQSHADFYSDLFETRDFQNFMGRDKELSTFNSKSFHVGATYEFAKGGWRFIKRGTVNLFYDHMMFDYDDFRDARDRALVAGTEPLYSFGANVFQCFVSVWF